MWSTTSTNSTSYRWPTRSLSIKARDPEFPVVLVPVAMQHYLLLQRNLLYTAMTRGRKLVVLVGQKKALALAIQNDRAAGRFSGLYERLRAIVADGNGPDYSNCRANRDRALCAAD